MFATSILHGQFSEIVLVSIFHQRQIRVTESFRCTEMQQKSGRVTKKKKQTSRYTGNIICPSISFEDAQDFMS